MQEDAARMKCPACGRFLGVVDGDYFEAVPCPCGWQTTMRRPGARRPDRRRTISDLAPLPVDRAG